MTAFLYSTIWVATALFAAAEAGKRHFPKPIPAWAWPAWMLAAALCTVHVVLAFAGPHGWSHAAAVRETARQTAAVYGVNWGGGIYVNYVFVAAWWIEGLWWRAAPERYFHRSPAITWTLRAFYLLIVFNALVVFAAAARRPLGATLTAALVWLWRPKPAAGIVPRLRARREDDGARLA